MKRVFQLEWLFDNLYRNNVDHMAYEQMTQIDLLYLTNALTWLSSHVWWKCATQLSYIGMAVMNNSLDAVWTDGQPSYVRFCEFWA